MSKLIIHVFCEDTGHKYTLEALINKILTQREIEYELKTLNATKGHGQVISELKKYFKELEIGLKVIPDIIIIGIDSNCKGYNTQRKEIEKETPDQFKNLTVHAIPDPHIEKWFLIDSHAFKAVFGTGCKAPDNKCEKDRFKSILADEMKKADYQPLIGGFEMVEDYIDSLDITRASNSDDSFKKFISDITRKLNETENMK